jgi:ubiquinone/menaquinone biosynthesis C-methylase UbiE
MNLSDTQTVEKTLEDSDVHDHWMKEYRTQVNEKFFDMAFDEIVRELNVSDNMTVLDAGCGTCAHSIRLARRGINVLATDFSGSVLEMALLNLKEKGVEDKVSLQREDLLSLSFQDHSIDRIVCWGVLMHIPDIKTAVAELSRVLDRDGILVLSEGNRYSLDSKIMHVLRKVFGKETATLKKTEAGNEFWEHSPAGELMTRQVDVRWIIKEFESHGLSLRKHLPGQFTEIYTRISWKPLNRTIHWFNRFWFKQVRSPFMSFGNILIFEKKR